MASPENPDPSRSAAGARVFIPRGSCKGGACKSLTFSLSPFAQTPMPEPPSPETLAWLRHAASCGHRDAQLTLLILERLEALEAAHREAAMDELREASADLQPTPEAAPVATDEELRVCATRCVTIAGSRRACYDLGREHGALAAAQPAAPAAPAGGLVERVADAIVTKATSAGIVDDRPARAAIREVAAWLRENEFGYHAAHALEQEAGR